MADEALPTAPARTAAVAVPVPGRRRWLILAVIGVAQLMVVLDATIVNIALPSAQRALGFSVTDRQWVITAYALAFGGLLVVGGRLSDLLGRKRTFMAGLAGFAAASAVGGAANGLAALVAARAVQGAFGALLAPSALACSPRPSPMPASAARRSASSPRSPAGEGRSA
jgi:MFS family permease